MSKSLVHHMLQPVSLEMVDDIKYVSSFKTSIKFGSCFVAWFIACMFWYMSKMTFILLCYLTESRFSLTTSSNQSLISTGEHFPTKSRSTFIDDSFYLSLLRNIMISPQSIVIKFIKKNSRRSNWKETWCTQHLVKHFDYLGTPRAPSSMFLPNTIHTKLIM